MRASDLIGHHVKTSTGAHIGRVFDVEVALSGPRVSDLHEHSLEVTQLLVGSRSSILRLGFNRREVGGPVGFRFLAKRLNGYKVAWGQVDEVGDEITLRVDRDALEDLE
jgi:sporulation protein YlmC with PRC-barrel domain